MYNLIIVDDEMQAVASVVEALDWKNLGIEDVSVAYSMKQAIDVFEKKSIDIMLCDIEMPKGNGIDLLKWVRGNKTDVESIFLTCHADFSYAKEAISLGSMDYLLKPVPFDELAAAVKKAVEKVDEKREINTKVTYGQNWIVNRQRLLEQFFLDLVKGEVKNEQEILEKVLDVRKLTDDIKPAYRMMVFDIKKYGALVAKWEKDIRMFSFKNIAEEVFDVCNGQLVVTFPVEDQLLLIVEEALESEEVQAISALCETYIGSVQRYLKSEVYAYVGPVTTVYEMAGIYEHLADQAKNNVLLNQQILTYQEKQSRKKVHSKPNGDLWRILFEEGKPTELEEEVTAYLDGCAMIGGIDAKFLEDFSQYFLQILLRGLGEKAITIQEVAKESAIKDYYYAASKSMSACKQATCQLIEDALNYIKETEEKMTNVDKAIQYIHDNLDGDVSRESVSAAVFLNPDYLNKLFKKEKGITVTDYIYQERMKLAANLLESSDLSIRDIAGRVGYSNFSYFSKMFSRYSGITPKAYRKQRSR